MSSLYNIDEAREFVEKNLEIRGFPDDPELQVIWNDILSYTPCMDGRGMTNRQGYEKLTKAEKLKKLGFSVPGGAVGIIVILYGVLNKLFDDKIHHIDPMIIKYMIGALIAKYGGKLKYHTDHHHPDSCLGCGFLKHSLKKNDNDSDYNLFGLKNSDIAGIYEFMDEFHGDIAILEGDHLEKAVLRVMPVVRNYKLFGLWHTDDQKGDQCFVINARTAMFGMKKMLGDLIELIMFYNLHDYVDFGKEKYRERYRKNGLIYSEKHAKAKPERYLDILLGKKFIQQFDNNVLEIYKILAPNHPIYDIYLDEEDKPVVLPFDTDFGSLKLL